MGYEISIDANSRIVQIRLADPMSNREHEKARVELIDVCRTENIHKILIDARKLVAAPSTMELFDFAASWPQSARQTPILLAGVLPEDKMARKWWRFGETVALNRGFATRPFNDLDEAVAWLRDT